MADFIIDGYKFYIFNGNLKNIDVYCNITGKYEKTIYTNNRTIIHKNLLYKLGQVNGKIFTVSDQKLIKYNWYVIDSPNYFNEIITELCSFDDKIYFITKRKNKLNFYQ